MDITDKRYSNQGLHVVLSLFTVEKGKFKVLLIKRTKCLFLNYIAKMTTANEDIKNNNNMHIGIVSKLLGYDKTFNFISNIIVR
jgi:hypothetical protein